METVNSGVLRGGKTFQGAGLTPAPSQRPGCFLPRCARGWPNVSPGCSLHLLRAQAASGSRTCQETVAWTDGSLPPCARPVGRCPTPERPGRTPAPAAWGLKAAAPWLPPPLGWCSFPFRGLSRRRTGRRRDVRKVLVSEWALGPAVSAPRKLLEMQTVYPLVDLLNQKPRAGVALAVCVLTGFPDDSDAS